MRPKHVTFFRILVLLAGCLLPFEGRCGAEPFRGYYITFMRMPLAGFPEWKDALDCLQEDRANVVILWLGGAFASKKYPITWEYNREHKNVQKDFVRELIDYAHTKRIRVLLGFTPFGYDGVNQFPLQHPELKAKKAEGKPVDSFGIHCWGWSLCPSQHGSQDFMLGYAREMVFDFYPNADGLLIESSDYNVCRCPECKDHYYEREFGFVRQISTEVWARNPKATIIVFPHYFSGRTVNKGTTIEAQAASLPFDPRWTLVFTPHSSQIDPELLQKANSSIYWNEGPSRGSPTAIREGARTARQNGITGYVPSMEPWSYVVTHEEFGESNLLHKRLKPFGFDWLPKGSSMPLRELLVRVQRFAYREFTQDPDLSDVDFRKKVGLEFFGSEDKLRETSDLLFLQEAVFEGRSWVSASPLVQPELFKLKAKREKWSTERVFAARKKVQRIQEIAMRYEKATAANEREMGRIAAFISERWTKESASVFDQ